ncbi:sigma 54-interacting transcriptional regulator [Clostridium estertheticum]|uniref:sigma 54-interacting transcriptional regulator n=1 Tax=Clostridium estertheticum TaxID=238834 RepID=UPI0013EE5D79|nr:sigma-54-dependent transcriptional regulator [Clostridium estertheticum]MBZ9607408.1 sigma 54-interacting transcriptional regulator [Clostridium estertheticum]
MKRIELVFNTLCKGIYESDDKASGFSAIEIAEKLNIQRTNACSDLNALIREGRIEKIKGKPVLYTVNNYEKLAIKANVDIFDSIVGAGLSLKSAVEQARAAIIYPPKGLHTLILGETGTGKSMFAELMFKYAKEIGKLKSNSPFVIFNCADYYNNSQLLMSQLFGVKKGAYTGADRDRVGLVEKANDGVLFLDEVHRLPPEGQEMLFYLMDKGIYRRFGETEVYHKVNILIIAATTENIDSSLLRTFTRRIPMIITLPSLKERTIYERFQIAKQSFKEEAVAIKGDISITANALKGMLLYDCSNNVGQLKSDIKISCAKAFLAKMMKRDKEVCVHSEDLPRYVLRGLLKAKEFKDELEKYAKKDIIIFALDESNVTEEKNLKVFNFYETLEGKRKLLEARGLNENDIKIIMSVDIDTYLKRYIFNISKQNLDELYKVVDKRVVDIVQEFLENASRLLDKEFSKKILYALAMHVGCSIERINRGKEIKNHKLEEIKKHNSLEYKISNELKEKMEQKFNVLVPEDEIAFITMFLIIDKEEIKIEGKVGIVVAMHGESAATSIADVTNRLLGENHAVGYNMPLDQKTETALVNLTHIIKTTHNGKGVILLVDMGSLVLFGDMIYEKTGIPVKTIDMVSTPMVLEATRKTLLYSTLEEVYDSCINLSPFMGKMYKDSLRFESNIKKDVIITACLTGQGAALKIKNILDQKFNLQSKGIDVIPINIDDKISFNKNIQNIKKERNLLGIIGAVKPEDDSVLYLSTYEIFIPERLEYLGETIDTIKTIENMKQVIEENVSIDANKLIESFKLFYLRLLNNQVILDEKNSVGLILHISCLVERILKREKLISTKNNEKFYDEYIKEINIIKSCLKPIEEVFNIGVSKSEIVYITKIVYLI